MAIETKASVAIDSLSEDEACGIFKLFGFEPQSAKRLYGGYASSNFKVVGKRAGEAEPRQLLLKINYYGLTLEDAEHQLHVMSHLKEHKFPTNYPHAAPDGRLLVEHDGRRAMLLDFIDGARPGQEVLAADEARAPRLLGDLGAALAQLHGVTWPAEPVMRDIRCGYPVCNTGDLLRGTEVEELLADERFAGHPFLAFVAGNLAWLRALYDREVPWGLIHGDGFLDNTLYEEGPPGSAECRLLALVDWEDSCVGPYALDLAVCASACCFTASNELIAERLRILLQAYNAKRRLLPKEVESFADFMKAGALACGFYRFGEFNVRKPESGAQEKDSYKIMFERAQRLEPGGKARETISAALEQLGAA